MQKSTAVVALLLVVGSFGTFDASSQTGGADAATSTSKSGIVSYPKIINAPDPKYPEDAARAFYQCKPLVALIVDPEGLPRDIHVTRPCDLGIDEAVVAAVSKSTFEPSQKNGEPVAVRIEIETGFRLAIELQAKDRDDLIERANNGDVLAELQLSNLYLQGTAGFSQDLSLGEKWQLKAAKAGQPLAQFLLARRLADQDPPAAYMWYSLAKEQGNDPAGVKLTDLTSKMSAEQLAEAQVRIEEWKRSHR